MTRQTTATRTFLFWLHLSIGVTAGVFIFIMAATGVMLSFERQIVELVDRDLRVVSVPQDARPRPMNDLLETLRRSGLGDATAIVVRNQPQATAQFSIGRGKTAYADPYTGAILGVSSARAHGFFFAVERVHRALGAPLGSKNIGHWLAAMSNLLFGVLILLGVFLWMPRVWTWRAVRASIALRAGLRGRARDWNWHYVFGIWCALPLLVIAVTGVVMSFDWANALLFRLTGSVPPTFGRPASKSGAGGGRPADSHQLWSAHEPNYEYMLTAAKSLNPDWRTITLNVVRDPNAPVSAVIDAGTGGQPQKRTQYVLNRDTGVVAKINTFASGSLGQRLRAFVRFGHTGEYGGWAGQTIAAIASLGGCVLVYSGLALGARRLTAVLRRKRDIIVSSRERYAQEPAA
jgi:uncharacterized iron-regulated membrane protein